LAAVGYLVLAVVAHVGALGFYTLIAPYVRPKHKQPPKEVEVVWVHTPASKNINLPKLPPPPPAMTPARPQPPRPPRPPAPAMAAAPTPPEKKAPPPRKPATTPPAPKPPEVAKQEPPKPPPPKVQPLKPPPPKPPEVAKVEPPKPEPKPEPPPPQPKQSIPRERHKSVEVDDDKSVVNEPPPEAEYWSDKNRRVAEQTRDTRTNLERKSKGDASASEKSANNDPEVGGEKDKVAQLEKTEATSLDAKRDKETAHSGKAEVAKGIQTGDKGEAGKSGQGGQQGDSGSPGMLSMRNAQGLGKPNTSPTPSPSPSGANDDAPTVAATPEPGAGGPAGRAGREGAPGKSGRKGPKLDLDASDYKRIVGEDAIKEEIQLARRSGSHKKGRWEKKMEQIHASLENFTPEVKTGNQTALGTRAAPFALYIARMHRTIHELWGFGFLEDLDGKAASNPMNDRKLAVKIEIILNPDGSLDRAPTIVRPSGVLTFDVAAIDTIMTAGPFGDTPEEIRSPNGKAYLHWTFHRDERQCSPYYADPFILAKAPEANAKRGLPDPAEEALRRKRAAGGPEKISRDGSPTKSTAVVPYGESVSENDPAAAARAVANLPAPDDPAAQTAAIAWLDAFEAGDVGRMTAVSATPFRSGETVAAKDAGGVDAVWQNVIGETPKRSVKEWKLLSAAGYRAAFGRAPKGAPEGTQLLFMVVRVGKEWLTLDVAQQGDGSYKVTGFTR
jgi:hypothetical protein